MVLAFPEGRSNHERLHRMLLITRAHLQIKSITALAMAEMPVEIATYEGDSSLKKGDITLHCKG